MRTLRPYQQAGVDFLSARTRAILGDEPGLGKSIQALRAACYTLGGNPSVLIVCPAIARVSWEIEAKAEGYEVHHITSSTGKICASGPKPLANIVSWDTLAMKDNTKLRALLRLCPFTHAILDEAHYAKSHAANRTKAVYGRNCQLTGSVISNVTHIWIMSGTLAPNHAGELWPHLRALFPDHLPTNLHDRIAFEDHFCTVRETTWGRQITGTKRDTLPELRAILGQIMLRRRKADVAQDLPALDFVDTPVDVDLSQTKGLPEIPKLLANASDDELIQWLKDTLGPVSTVRRTVGLLKVPGAAAWAAGQLDGGVRKLILFGVHKEVIDQLATRLGDYNPVTVTGATSHPDRAAAVQRFQTDPECRVFIGNILAAGTAITLTAASTVGIVEASWVPGENYQAACRAHRIGQNDGVLCHFLHMPGTLDDRVSKVFRRKASELASLFG